MEAASKPAPGRLARPRPCAASVEQRQRGCRQVGGVACTRKRSHAVEALEAQQADLQRQRREAVDRGDEQRMAELSSALDSNFDELRRADFPNHTRGWNLSRAIRKDSTFILDWTTGY